MNKEEQVIMSFNELFNKMSWLNKLKMEDILKDYSSSEIHYIECIGRNVGSNVTKLAKSLYMTRGAISKMTKKLIKKGIVESYQKPHNKKEIYFWLTEQGQEIYKVYEQLHKEFEERDKSVFEHITEEQFDSMLSFTKKYTMHLDSEIRKLNIDIKSDKFEL